MNLRTTARWLMLAALALPAIANAQATSRPAKPNSLSHKDVAYPPTLPGGVTVVTDSSDDFLKSPIALNSDVTIAKTAPTITFMYFPGQDWAGNPWSAWGDSLFVNGKYYASISDHLAPRGHAYVYDYDPTTRSLRQVVDVTKTLNLPEGDYTAGKIHGRLDLGSDGWIYFSTHRGSATATTAKYNYKGDWILRYNPADSKSEVVAQGPVPMHCIPNSVLDPDRLIFYGGTAPGGEKGEDSKGIQFFAYDIKAKKTSFVTADGPGRYMMFAKSTGRLYYVPGTGEGTLMRYDPAVGNVVALDGKIMGNRAATQETPQGLIYSVSQSTKTTPAAIWSLNTKTEEVKKIGTAPIVSDGYIASLDADPTGRYLYYVPGAHGSGVREGTPVVQFDTQSGQKKVIAFLADFYTRRYGLTPKGTYSVAIDDTGSKLHITWNVARDTKAWDCTGLTVIEIPESERKP